MACARREERTRMPRLCRTVISNVLENARPLVSLAPNVEIDSPHTGTLSRGQRSTPNMAQRAQIEQTIVRNIYRCHLSRPNANAKFLLIHFQISLSRCLCEFFLSLSDRFIRQITTLFFLAQQTNKTSPKKGTAKIDPMFMYILDRYSFVYQIIVVYLL